MSDRDVLSGEEDGDRNGDENMPPGVNTETMAKTDNKASEAHISQDSCGKIKEEPKDDIKVRYSSYVLHVNS